MIDNNHAEKNDSTETRQDDINLRQLIEALICYRKMIISIVVVSVIAAALVTFISHKPAYEAEATVLILPPRELPGSGTQPVSVQLAGEEDMAIMRKLTSMTAVNQLLERLDFEFSGQTITEEVLRMMLLSDAVVIEMIDQLDLDPTVYSPAYIRKAVSIHPVNGDNYFRIRVKTAESETPVLIANHLASQVEKAIDAVDLHDDTIFETIDRLITETEAETAAARQELTELALASAQPPSSQEMRQLETKIFFLEDLSESLMIKAVQLEWIMAFESVDADVKIINEAALANVATPRTGLNIGIGAVLGLILGITAAFFMMYWDRTKNLDKRKS